MNKMPDAKRKSVAIVGMGRFGKTLYRLLRGDFNIVIWNPGLKARRGLSLRPGDRIAAGEREISSCDAVFYAVPIAAFERILRSHRRFLRPEQLIIDVLSVKVHPAKVLQGLFGKNGPRAILTHPLFGPDSSQAGFRGLPMVMNKFTARPAEYRFWKQYFQKKGLRTVEMTPAEHDRLAARSQGVAHFIGRLLEDFGFAPTSIDTAGVKKLHELEAQVCRDTKELFLNLQNYNPYTREMRIGLGRSYSRLYNALLPKRVRLGTLTFGIQGGAGSFNEQTLREYVKRKRIRNYEVRYLFTSERVLRQLHEGRIDLGLFAMHNAVGGTVQESVEALAKYNCVIRDEEAVLIRHFLMRRKDNRLASPARIMAHDQVFRQCKATLARKYPRVKLVSGKGDLADTARAAEALAAGKIAKTTFILGPRVLAEMYGLEVVDRDLQDEKQNYTTFLVVARR